MRPYSPDVLWLDPVAEMVYEDLYVDYYYPRAGYKQHFFREDTPMHFTTEIDEAGKPIDICHLGSAHVGSAWRPIAQRSQGRRGSPQRA